MASREVPEASRDQYANVTNDSTPGRSRARRSQTLLERQETLSQEVSLSNTTSVKETICS